MPADPLDFGCKPRPIPYGCDDDPLIAGAPCVLVELSWPPVVVWAQRFGGRGHATVRRRGRDDGWASPQSLYPVAAFPYLAARWVADHGDDDAR